jgi:hypothetical protein
VTDSNVPEQEPDKPASVGLLGRIRARLTRLSAGRLPQLRPSVRWPAASDKVSFWHF